jgi:uncharacterized protein YcnI
MSSRRISVLVFGVALVWGTLALPAWAHVVVEAQPGSPGATDATLKITAAGESSKAGISKIDVTADPPILADQITLISGPSGWTVTPGSQGGFAIGGPALAKGDDAVVSLKVKQLPSAPQVVFKVLQTYSDGDVERWIELPGPDGKEPDKPAPIVKLSAGAASAVSPAPANDEDAAADHHDATSESGSSLARTGAGDRSLVVAAGLLLLAGGWSVLIGTPKRQLAKR